VRKLPYIVLLGCVGRRTFVLRFTVRYTRYIILWKISFSVRNGVAYRQARRKCGGAVERLRLENKHARDPRMSRELLKSNNNTIII